MIGYIIRVSEYQSKRVLEIEFSLIQSFFIYLSVWVLQKKKKN